MKVKEAQILTSEELELLSGNKKPASDLERYYQEYSLLHRDLRDTQVHFTQKDKTIIKTVAINDANGFPIKNTDGSEKKRKEKVLKKAIRLPIPLQNNIVRTSVAFEIGNAPDIIPNTKNELSEEVVNIWNENRLHSKLIKLKTEQKSITQSALIFYIKKTEGDNPNKIKTKTLTYEDGMFYPVFNDFKDMISFVWEFETREGVDKVKNIWIFDSSVIKKYKQTKTKFTLESNDKHFFDKIPVVYFSQNKPEYYNVKELIDRYETALSKLGAANNYSGHPILFTSGQFTSSPDRDADGKHLNASIGIDPNTEKEIRGDAKFLTHDNAPDSVKLELELLRELINEGSATPSLSLKSLQGVGNIAGASLELLFLNPIIKAKFNEGQNSVDIKRMLNIIISGIINNTNTSLKSLSKDFRFEIKFNSILPNNLDQLVTTLTSAKSAGLIAQETAIDMLSFTDNTTEELDLINKQSNNEKRIETET